MNRGNMIPMEVEWGTASMNRVLRGAKAASIYALFTFAVLVSLVFPYQYLVYLSIGTGTCALLEPSVQLSMLHGTLNIRLVAFHKGSVRFEKDGWF
jgi:hypothetical protein